MIEPLSDLSQSVDVGNRFRWAGWRAYFGERFPVFLYSLLIANFCLANHFLAQVLNRPGQAVSLDFRLASEFAILFCLFFQIRVFDDDKDYRDDSRLYPTRALQRGAVTRRQLLRLAALAIILEMVFAWIAGGAVLFTTATALGFTLLIWRDFFARNWLKRHVLFSALLHLLVVPLLALIVYSCATGEFPASVEPRFFIFALVGYLLAFSAEISRKVLAPQDECAERMTYSRIWGIPKVAGRLCFLCCVETVLAGLLGYQLELGKLFFVVLGLLLAANVWTVLRFRRRPTRRFANSLKTISGLYMLGFDLNWIAALGAQYGVRWQ